MRHLLNRKKRRWSKKEEGGESVYCFAEDKDIAPSSVLEVAPGEERPDGEGNMVKSRDYYVEIGATSEDVRFSKTFYAVFSGTHTWDGMLNPLYTGDFGDGDIDTSIRIQPSDTSRVLKEIARRIAGLESDIALSNNQQKIQAMAMEVRDLKEQQRRLRMNEEKIFRVALHTTVSALSYQKMRQIANAVVKKFSALNINLRSCDLFQLEALMHVTPFGAKPERRYFKTLETSCVADFFPFGLGGLSHKEGIILGYDQMGHPVLFDGWHPRFDGYNMVILGRTGSGKSFSIKLITLRSAIMGIRTAIVDPQREYQAMAEAMDCPYISLSPDSPHHINILDLEPQTNPDGTESLSIEDAVRAALPVIYRMIRSIEPTAVTGIVKTRLQQHLFQLYRNFGFTDDINTLYERRGLDVKPQKRPMPTLSDLYLQIKEDPELTQVAEYLKTFTKYGDSKYQSVFDCQSNVDIRNAPFFVFSLAAFQDDEIMKPIALYVATKWVWERFGKKNPKVRKRIIADEAHLLMQDQESANWLISAFKMARKHNTSMCAVTQGFLDLTRVPNGIAILQNAAVRILLKQDQADIDAVAKHISLSEGEKRVLLTADKGTAILKAGSESTLVQFKASPNEFALFNTDPNIGRQQAKEG